MDPRIREDDAWESSRHSGIFPVIPAEPALDLIGGQESIPAPACSTGKIVQLFSLHNLTLQ